MKENKITDIAEKIDLAKAKYFPDEAMLRSCYMSLPADMRPLYGVFCATDQDLALAQALAPSYEKVHFLLPEDVGLRRVRNKRL